jgi:hypothetical protein
MYVTVHLKQPTQGQRGPRLIAVPIKAGQCAPLFGLAPSGVYPATDITTSAVRSYRTISPLPTKAGGIFSVALSIGSRLPDVIWHSVLRSPDFPLSAKRQRAITRPTPGASVR